MGMEMLDTIPPSPSRENRRLEEIGDMQRKAAIRPPTDADGCAQRREKGAGTRNQEMKRATDEDESARGDDEVRLPYFEDVLGVDEGLGPWPQRVSDDLYAEPFEGPYLPADESVTGGGVTIDEVSDPERGV